jgi:NitT/TauT family transport system substrate-binding protein/sulfonate transport system substrate-binding protein
MPQQVTPIVPTFSRRTFTRLGLGMTAASVAGPLWAQATPKVIRLGYQKLNTLNILKGTGNLEKALAPLGVKVE